MLLTPHPESPSDNVRALEAEVSWAKDGALAFTYALKGDLSRLEIPPPRPPARADGLWRHTCFEAFVSLEDDSAYYELNFAPSGEWAFYRFDRYREMAPIAEISPPEIGVRRVKDGLELDALVDAGRLNLSRKSGRLKIALSAVIEDGGGALSYWALKHAPGKPDFHHPDAFTLELEPWNG